MEFDQSSKVKFMLAVQDAIQKSGLATAKVWNPWKSVLDPQVSTKDVVASVGNVIVPEVITEGSTFASLSLNQKIAFGASTNLGKITQETFDQACVLLKRAYLQSGAATYRGLTGANCTLFACCVLGMLADQVKIVPEGTVVELFNLTDASSGHAYVVVNRKGGQLTDPATFGPDAFIVDQWYARQQFTELGKRGVKDPDLAGKSDFADPKFYEWITTEPKVTVRLRFSREDLVHFRG